MDDSGIHFRCRSCGQAMVADAEDVGAEVECPSCGVPRLIPSESDTGADPTAMPPATPATPPAAQPSASSPSTSEAADWFDVNCPRCKAANPVEHDCIGAETKCIRCGASWLIPKVGEPARELQIEPGLYEDTDTHNLESLPEALADSAAATLGVTDSSWAAAAESAAVSSEFNFPCPHCGSCLRAEVGDAGQLTDCVDCGKELRIPNPRDPSVAVSGPGSGVKGSAALASLASAMLKRKNDPVIDDDELSQLLGVSYTKGGDREGQSLLDALLHDELEAHREEAKRDQAAAAVESTSKSAADMASRSTARNPALPANAPLEAAPTSAAAPTATSSSGALAQSGSGSQTGASSPASPPTQLDQSPESAADVQSTRKSTSRRIPSLKGSLKWHTSEELLKDVVSRIHRGMLKHSAPFFAGQHDLSLAVHKATPNEYPLRFSVYWFASRVLLGFTAEHVLVSVPAQKRLLVLRPWEVWLQTRFRRPESSDTGEGLASLRVFKLGQGKAKELVVELDATFTAQDSDAKNALKLRKLVTAWIEAHPHIQELRKRVSGLMHPDTTAGVDSDSH